MSEIIGESINVFSENFIISGIYSPIESSKMNMWYIKSFEGEKSANCYFNPTFENKKFVIHNVFSNYSFSLLVSVVLILGIKSFERSFFDSIRSHKDSNYTIRYVFKTALIITIIMSIIYFNTPF